jgi:hypothetical protein
MPRGEGAFNGSSQRNPAGIRQSPRFPKFAKNSKERERERGVASRPGHLKQQKGVWTMRNTAISLAGAALIALAFAPQPASARNGPDWGVTVSPGGIYIGPKYDYSYHHHRYNRSNEYSYSDRDRDYDYWRYRHHDWRYD